jgi:hypothetical protein
MNKPSDRKKFHDPRVVLYNFDGSPFEREGVRISSSLCSSARVIWTKSLDKLRVEAINEAIVIFHEEDRLKAYRICREYRDEPNFRLMLVTRRPELEEDMFNDLRRYTCVGAGAEDIVSEAGYYLPVCYRRSKFKWQARDSKDSKVKSYHYLRKGCGKLVWNMEEHQAYLNDRDRELMSKVPFYSRLRLSDPADIYL